MSREQQYAEMVNTKRSIQQILRTEGFEFYQNLLDEQIHERREAAEQPARGVDGFIAREFLAGEVHGLKLARNILQGLESTADEVIEALQHEAKLEETE